MAGGLAEDAGEINERKNNCYWSQEICYSIFGKDVVYSEKQR